MGNITVSKVKSSVSLYSSQYIIHLLMTCLWFSMTKGVFLLWMDNEQLPTDQPHHFRFQYVKVIAS